MNASTVHSRQADNTLPRRTATATAEDVPSDRPALSAQVEGEAREQASGAPPAGTMGRAGPPRPRATGLGRLGARYGMALLLWGAGIGAGLIAPTLLRRAGLIAPIDTSFTVLGFDEQRVAIIDHLFAAMLGGTIAATVFQRRIAAFVGALADYILNYMLPLARVVLHPGPSPAGLPQTVIPAAFQQMVLTVMGLGILFALLGASLGKTLGELLVVPLVTAARQLIGRVRGQRTPIARGWVWLPIALVTGIIVLVAAGFGIQGVDGILTYGPTLGLYQTSAGTKSDSAGTPIAHGTVEKASFRSAALGGIERTYYIYLPPSYQTEPGNRYPTIYLLHGSPGTPHNWVGAAQAAATADALIAAGKMRETILVSPDGNGPTYLVSAWANSYDGRQRMEDFVVQDLVPYIDQHYRTVNDPAYRAIGGISEGGYGATNIALHHPEVFGGVLSEGGYFVGEDAVLGTGPAQASYRLYNSPLNYIATPAGKVALRTLRFVICVGTRDGIYFDYGKAFAQQIQHLGGHVTLIQSEGGHAWPLWASQFGQAAPLLEPPTPTASGNTLVHT